MAARESLPARFSVTSVTDLTCVARGCSGVPQEWGPPHALARFGPIHLVGACAPSRGCEVPAFAGTTGGVNPGPIWPCLASFTPSRAMEMRPVWPRFGPPLTRTRWASRPWLWPWLASSGVPRSGETFNSVSFSLIWSHFLSSAQAGDARFPPSRERRVAFVITTYATTVRAGAATAQWAVVVGLGSALGASPSS